MRALVDGILSDLGWILWWVVGMSWVVERLEFCGRLW